MSKGTAFLPRAHNPDAKHKLKRVKSLLLRQCRWALFHRLMEPLNDQLSYPATSRKNLVCEYKHTQPMASLGNRTSVLQAARTRSLYAERCLPIHAGARGQNNSPGAEAASGSSGGLREILTWDTFRTEGQLTISDVEQNVSGSGWVGMLS